MVVFEKSFGRYYFIRSGLGYATFAGANQPVAWSENKVESDDNQIWRLTIMSNGSVQFISKAPGNRTLDVRNWVLNTDILDDVVDREEFLMRKDCLEQTSELNRNGETTVMSQGKTQSL